MAGKLATWAIPPDILEVVKALELAIRVRRAAYYAEHREDILAYQAAYRAEHREDNLAYQAAYHAEHRDSINAKRAAGRAVSREMFAALKAKVKGSHRKGLIVNCTTSARTKKGKKER